MKIADSIRPSLTRSKLGLTQSSLDLKILFDLALSPLTYSCHRKLALLGSERAPNKVLMDGGHPV